MPLYLQPDSNSLTELPDWFADRVEITTDRLTIPRGVYLIVNAHLVKRLVRKLDRSKGDQAERIRSILEQIQQQGVDTPGFETKVPLARPTAPLIG